MLGLPELQYLLAQDSSGDEDKDSDLESHFPAVTHVEAGETVVDISPGEVRRAADLGDYGSSAEISLDIENPDDLQLDHMCKMSIHSTFI